MPYPRNIRLSSERLDALRSFLDDEFLRHYAERQDWIEDIKNWQKDYWAKPKTERATFPFTGASRIIIPLTAISFEAVHARTMTTLFGLDQFAYAKAKTDTWADAAQFVEKALDHEILQNPRNYSQIDSSVMEIEKFGTGVAKSSYEYLQKRAIRDVTGPDGKVVSSREVIVTHRQGAVIDSVPIGNFIMPFFNQDPQTAPWCGEEHAESPYYVKRLVDSGFFYPETWDNIKAWVSYSRSLTGPFQTRVQQIQQEDLENRAAVWPKTLDWFEVWVGFDVNDDGEDEEIVVHYHKQSQTFMSIRYNWLSDLHRPYRKANYFSVEHRWTGIGICKQNEQFQREITTMHRQRLDAGTIANVPMLKVHKMSGYGSKEPIFPGKMWLLDDMSHIEPFKMSEVSASSFSNEQASAIYSQQRTGVNEVVLGMPQVGTPGTATSDLARIQEGNKKFDFVYKNIKTWMSELVVDVAVNIAQFGARNIEYFDMVDGGQLAKAFFSLPPELIRQNFLIEIGAAGQQQNKILDRQNWTQLAPLIQQYYAGMVQIAEVMQNPQLLQMIGQNGLIAATEAMRQILETFDARNIDRIIMTQFTKPQGAVNGAPNIPQLGSGIIQPGAGPAASIGPPPNGAAPGMGVLNRLASLIGSPNGNGVPGVQ